MTPLDGFLLGITGVLLVVLGMVRAYPPRRRLSRAEVERYNSFRRRAEIEIEELR